MTPSTRLKMAVFAPIPSARVAIAIALKPGFFRSIRPANLRSETSVSSIAACFDRFNTTEPRSWFLTMPRLLYLLKLLRDVFARNEGRLNGGTATGLQIDAGGASFQGLEHSRILLQGSRFHSSGRIQMVPSRLDPVNAEMAIRASPHGARLPLCVRFYRCQNQQDAVRLLRRHATHRALHASHLGRNDGPHRAARTRKYTKCTAAHFLASYRKRFHIALHVLYPQTPAACHHAGE